LSSFVWHKPLPILGYLGAEALRAKERTTRCCRCVTVEFGWLAKPWAITASRVVLKKSNLHRKLVTAALDIRLVDNRYTSSTAQGGGGSFKNKKPIGEVGCCESGMAE